VPHTLARKMLKTVAFAPIASADVAITILEQAEERRQRVTHAG
jgi:hypothetical protein